MAVNPSQFELAVDMVKPPPVPAQSSTAAAQSPTRPPGKNFGPSVSDKARSPNDELASRRTLASEDCVAELAANDEPQQLIRPVDFGSRDSWIMRTAYPFLIGLPPWTLSAAGHIGVLIVLAFFSLSNRSESSFIVEVDNSPQTEELLTFEFEYDSEDQLKALEAGGLDSDSEMDALELPETPMIQIGPKLPDGFEQLAGLDGMASPNSRGESNASAGGEGDGDGDGSGSATFCGIEAKGKSFVFVLDNSGSMSGYRWFQARAEIIHSISQLDENQKFLVVLYNTYTSVMLGQRGSEIAYLEATPKNRRRVVKWLDRQFPQFDTFPKRSLKIAMRMEPDAVFLLSDGEFRDGSVEFLRSANLSGTTPKCSVHTIAFKSRLGASMLRQIAHENGGSFRYVE